MSARGHKMHKGAKDPVSDVTGVVYHGRRILREIDPVCYGGGGEKVRRHRQVSTICLECGLLADVLLSSAKKGGCATCRNRQVPVEIDPDSLGTTVGRLLLEAGERCPELWRNNRPEDREIVMDAISELVGTIADHRGQSGMSHEEVGAMMGVTRQRVHQIEGVTLKRCRLAFGAAGREYAEHLDERGDEHVWWTG